MGRGNGWVNVIAVTLFLSFAVSRLVWGSSEDNGTSIYKLEPVVITATRTPTKLSQLVRNVRVIDAEDIENSPAHSVEELLKYNLGIDIRQRGPFGVQADSSIRGSTFSQVLILVNGIRINDPQTAHHNFDLGLALESIERIEVLYGHGSSLYGADAFGGVINIITKKPEKRSGYMDFSYGDYSTSVITGGFSGKSGGLGSSFSVERKKSDGYRPDTDFDIITFSSDSTLNLSELGLLELFLGYTDKDFGANDFYADYPSKEWTETLFMSLGAELKKGAILKPKVYYRRHKDEFLLDINEPDGYFNHHVTHIYGAEFQSHIPLGLFGNLVLGGEGVREEIESTGLGDHDAFRSAVYAAGEALFADRYILNLGIRGDHHSIYGLEWTPSVGAGLRVSAFKLRCSAGRTFRSPSFTELYYESPGNLGNPQLKPESAWSYELGVDYYHPEDRSYFGITSFIRDESNLIDWVKPDDASPQWKAENITKARIRGVETVLEVKPVKSLSVLLNYTFLQSDVSKQGEYESKYALEHPEHAFGVRFGCRLPFGFQTSANVLYKKKRAEEKGYAPLDISLSKKFSMGQIYVKGTNILNTETEYEEIKGIPMPGRWVQVGVKLAL